MKSILLVDSETIICAEFTRTLQRFGFHVKSAHSLAAALRSIRKERFDAILLEFNLTSGRKTHPTTGNGLQLVRRLRAAAVTAPILMFTAMEGEPYETASRDADADEFIPKTAGVPRLVSRLRDHLHKHDLIFGRAAVL